MPLTPLNHYALENHPTVYDEESLTALELCARSAHKVNECVKEFNTHEETTNKHLKEQDDEIKTHFDRLTKDVPAWVYDWLEAHPEVTTTLQDGEIMMEKFHPALPLKDFVTPQMYGAKADGKTDDTAAIQRAIDTGCSVYFPGGTYMVNGTNPGWGQFDVGGIKPKSNSSLILAPDAILKAIPTSSKFYHVINLDGVENVTISGGTIIGDNAEHTGTSGEWGYGVAIYGCNRIRIENIEIHSCWGDGIVINSLSEVTGNNHNITIDKCIIHDCRRQGISAIIGGKNIVISNCHIYNISGTAPQSGIDIEPNADGETFDGLTITGCTIHDTVGASIIMNRCTNTHVTNCNLQSINYWVYSYNNHVDNCKIDRITVFGPKLWVSNCKLTRVSFQGGSASFNGCEFESTGDYIITAGNDMEHIGDFAKFVGCHFTTGDETQVLYYQNGGRVKLTEFIDCVFYNLCHSFIISAFETRVSGCKFIFGGNSVYSLFQCYNAYDATGFKATLENSRFENANITYLYTIDGAGAPTVIVRNNYIPGFANGIYTSAAVAGRYICYDNVFHNAGNQIYVLGSGSGTYTLSNHNNISLS